MLRLPNQMKLPDDCQVTKMQMGILEKGFFVKDGTNEIFFALSRGNLTLVFPVAADGSIKEQDSQIAPNPLTQIEVINSPETLGINFKWISEKVIHA